jgi:hypothetical protein
MGFFTVTQQTWACLVNSKTTESNRIISQSVYYSNLTTYLNGSILITLFSNTVIIVYLYTPDEG